MTPIRLEQTINVALSEDGARRYLAAFKATRELMPRREDDDVFGEIARQIVEKLERLAADRADWILRANAAADEALPYLEMAAQHDGWLAGDDRFWLGIEQVLSDRGECLQTVVSQSAGGDVQVMGYRLCPTGQVESATVRIQEAGRRFTATTRPRQLGGQRSGRACSDPSCLIQGPHEAHA